MHPPRIARRWFGLIVLCAGMLGSAGQSRAVINDPTSVAGSSPPMLVSFVKDLAPGAQDSYGIQTFAVSDTLYLTASLEEMPSGYEVLGKLWRSDGTVSGTISLMDYYTFRYPNSYKINDTAAINERLYFSIVVECDSARPDNCPDTIGELRYTEPGITTTVEVKTFPNFISDFTALDGMLLFDYGDLWRSNGTSAGTIKIKDFNYISSQIVSAGNVVYFAANDDSHGAELWRSNGTNSGTTLVKDAIAGANGVVPANLTMSGDLLYFTGYTAAYGRELWRSDGTANGTVMITDVLTDSFDAQPTNLTDVADSLYFVANANQLWRSDGTMTTTSKVMDLGADIEQFSHFVVADGLLYFTIEREAGEELWRSDGTAAGTLLLKELGDCYSFYDRTSAAHFQGLLYFAVSCGQEAGLWYTDGTVAGTGRQSTLVPELLTATNSRLYFFADDAVHGNELWSLSPASDVVYLPMIQR